MATQIKRGYMRGCRGLLITGLNPDGSMPENPVRYWIDTAQEASIETEVVEGEQSDLRGGDRLLARVEENDVVTGVNLSFTNARFDAQVVQLFMGGTLITEVVGETEEIIGWEAPTVAAQAEKRPVQAELYVQSFNSEGGREAYLRYKFPYCIGVLGSVEHSDQEWGTPEFSLKARENPSTGASAYSKQFVEDLPDMPYAVIVADVVGGGTAEVTTDPSGSVLSGSTVTVTIANIEAGYEFASIRVVDADEEVVSTTEVTPGEEYTFTMPRKAVTVTVTLAVVSQG